MFEMDDETILIIEESKKKYGGKYDDHNSVYIKVKVIIKRKGYDGFNILPAWSLLGKRCAKCGK